MKVLVTGGSGFIAAHCIDVLLERGHDVVFTVRSTQKGEMILKSHQDVSKSRLSFVIVEDIVQEGAFDEAVKSNPPFEAVLHMASPFLYNIKDAKRDLLDPAIVGTTGILQAVKQSAPTVKCVVITSSFAAMMDQSNPPRTYSESNWNPVTWEEAVAGDGAGAYRASKTFAEKAAWDFVRDEKPSFEVATLNPGLVLGPVVHYFNSLDAINTSNQRIRDMILGKYKDDGLPPSGLFIWVDVRDAALAHVKIAESESNYGKRFFCTAGHMSNAAIAEVIKDQFPEYREKLPVELKDDRPKDVYGFDNSRSKEMLGLDYRPLESCIIDTVKSLQAAGA